MQHPRADTQFNFTCCARQRPNQIVHQTVALPQVHCEWNRNGNIEMCWCTSVAMRCSGFSNTSAVVSDEREREFGLPVGYSSAGTIEAVQHEHHHQERDSNRNNSSTSSGSSNSSSGSLNRNWIETIVWVKCFDGVVWFIVRRIVVLLVVPSMCASAVNVWCCACACVLYSSLTLIHKLNNIVLFIPLYRIATILR